eukprot:3557674-Karenia_brevis.AAC.1
MCIRDSCNAAISAQALKVAFEVDGPQHFLDRIGGACAHLPGGQGHWERSATAGHASPASLTSLPVFEVNKKSWGLASPGTNMDANLISFSAAISCNGKGLAAG